MATGLGAPCLSAGWTLQYGYGFAGYGALEDDREGWADTLRRSQSHLGRFSFVRSLTYRYTTNLKHR